MTTTLRVGEVRLIREIAQTLAEMGAAEVALIHHHNPQMCGTYRDLIMAAERKLAQQVEHLTFRESTTPPVPQPKPQTVEDVLKYGVLRCDKCGKLHTSSGSNLCIRCRIAKRGIQSSGVTWAPRGIQ